MTNNHFKLPRLGYAYDALEPAYSAELLELHYANHHQAYVDGANRALAALAEMRGCGDFSRINQLEKDLAFYLSGHVLHSIFWRNLEPDSNTPPASTLASHIQTAFGSMDALRRQFAAAGSALQGSGWVALAWEMTSGSLIVEQIHDHQGNCGMATIPLLVMDMWEHAYYLQYRNQKGRWIYAFWSLINWSDVSRRLDNAERADLALDPLERERYLLSGAGS